MKNFIRAAIIILMTSSSQAWAKDTVIEIKNHQFTPAAITVTAGTTVIWINKDDDPHTVLAKGGVFHSAALDTNDKYSYTFTKPGTYKYLCTMHPVMTGSIIVK
ncbi:MAG TPA: cupredoxin family copper-binding protein [Rickettsiales bacterium]|nr:cupredoxin family copper-binding protein [Rickettsiales bacterium]